MLRMKLSVTIKVGDKVIVKWSQLVWIPMTRGNEQKACFNC